jgi:hypothetical protein
MEIGGPRRGPKLDEFLGRGCRGGSGPPWGGMPFIIGR